MVLSTVIVSDIDVDRHYMVSQLASSGYSGSRVFEDPSLDDAIIGVLPDGRVVYSSEVLAACVVDAYDFGPSLAARTVFRAARACEGDPTAPAIMACL